ncbi:PepSY-like domain-containing protein [Mesonia sp. HuA40]|uniref:PepSY-like domain-containing protein n=1 Tax=Mesonia sp. HuA40 TaxID=2602761 RepID=UPI0011CCA188|nr:PepSY-like domain-containing protein [Mesonia sp. HuA40]TXK74787.1 hypothetical protein FT993_01655 [Mesonia sp. HuA40]
MKKIILGGAMALFGFSFMQAQSVNDLPQPAKDVIQKHYKAWKVDKVNIDKDDRQEAFQVKFANGAKMDFNIEGYLTEIKGDTEIPAALIPEKVKYFVQNKYPEQKIIEWEYEDGKHEIGLDNGTELEFDGNGKFLKVD